MTKEQGKPYYVSIYGDLERERTERAKPKAEKSTPSATTKRQPPAEHPAPRKIEQGIIDDAKRNKKELVLNPYHPDNRKPKLDAEESFEERINRGVKKIQEDLGKLPERMNPEYPWE